MILLVGTVTVPCLGKNRAFFLQWLCFQDMVAASHTKTMKNSLQAMNLHAVVLISMSPTYDICLIPHVARFSPVRSVASRLFPPCFPPCLQGRFSVRVLLAIFNCQRHHCFISAASRSSLSIYISLIAFDCLFPSFPFFNP